MFEIGKLGFLCYINIREAVLSCYKRIKQQSNFMNEISTSNNISGLIRKTFLKRGQFQTQ